MKVAIYSGEIPSTSFVENLISGVAEEHQVFLFGKKRKAYRYHQRNIKVVETPRSTIFLLFFIAKYTLLLLLKHPVKLRKLIKNNRAKSVVLKLKFLGEALPIVYSGVDIFHIQWVKGADKWLFLKEFGVKVMVSFRGAHINYSPLADKKLVEVYQQTLKQYDAYHAVSKAIFKEACKYQLNLEVPKAIIPGAVKSSLLENTNKGKESSEVIQILSVGRNHWKKGYSLAIDACHKLKQEGIAFKYTIIGGKDSEELIWQIYDLNLMDEVELVGAVDYEKIMDYYKSYDMFLLPSLEEGIANVVLEAMANGIPVVSSDCGGMAEVIQDGQNGWLFKNMDEESCFDKMKQCIAMNIEKHNQMVDAAYQTIKNHHLIEQQITSMLHLYQQISVQ